MDATTTPAARPSIEESVEIAAAFLAGLGYQPHEWIELRLLPVAASRWFQLSNVPATRAALRWAGERNARTPDADNVYFGVSPRTGNGKRGDENVAAFIAVFADWDGVPPEEALARIRAAGLPEPSIVIASGGGTHAYWLLDESTADADEWRARMRGIARAVKSDTSICNPERIMRLVGYANVKPKYPERPLCRVVQRTDTRHPLDVFPRGDQPEERVTTATTTPARPRGRLGDEGQRYIESGHVEGERRPAIFRIACDMKARGWSLGQASEAITSRAHKIQPALTADEIDDLPRQIENAFAKEREPGYEATPTQKAAAAIVASATDDEPHSGGADLSRPHTLTDVGLGRRLAKMIRGRMTYVRERKTWLYWDGRRHADQGEHIAEQHAKRLHDEMWGDLAALDHHERTAAVVKFVHDSGTRARIAAAIAMAQSEPGINTSQSEYDSHPWLLNVRNGVVDLRSGELLPHDPKLRITQLAAVEYVPDARSELWERFIREVTRGDDDVAEFLQQAFGLALTGDVSDEVLICHNGGGCNGKSTALEAVGKMLGDYAAVAPPGLFTARKFDSHPTELAGLRGKRFVTAIEQEGNRALRESLIKQMTGGDTIRTRGMREDFWEMQPTWHIHIAYNTAPRLTGTDDGIRRRLVVVPWNASFKGAPDATVKERLTGEAERAGILNWCVEGLRKRLAAGRIEVPEACRISTDEYIDDEDLIGRFIAERTEIEQGHMIELREMLRAFREWMQADGSPRYVVDGYTANALGRELARRGFRKVRPDSGVHRKQTVVMGLRLVHTADDLPGYHDEEWATFHR